ncbi:ATPase [Flavobacterium psychrophilum]|nr:ATPase [Flavobacterium psychrophilum]AOE53190.1 ATPase [Flavobacterium psychrophilum]
MEENITTRKSSVIITIYGDGLNGRTVSEELKSFIDRKGNNDRTFTFRTVSIDRALNENDKSAHLFIILNATNTTIDASIKKLTRTLTNNHQPNIMINSTPADFTVKSKEALVELEKALDIGFSAADFAEIYERGVTLDNIQQQLSIFKNGITKATLKKPALYNDGIFELEESAAINYAALFDSKKESLKLTKFVPASGAATRMFKFLCEFIAEFNPQKETINAYINRKNDINLRVFLVGLDKFPFYNEILDVVRQQDGFPAWTKDKKTYEFIKIMLDSHAFNYANKPKGILPFHHYGAFIATPIYEHLKETVAYASSQNEANIQFTISEDHLDGFLDGIQDVKQQIEDEHNTKINISFSYQQKSTDTLAVTINNVPFRDNEGKLLFRPGGHGALIENLGQLDADIVFIKNIDNVSHNNTELISLYKKALAGILVEYQQQIFTYLEQIDNNELDEDGIDAVLAFAKEKLLLHIPSDINKYTTNYKKEFAKDLLNRPIRVCGMVKNEGEPGGGPFWVESDKGIQSLQIVESSQVDLDNVKQKNIFANASHFNPVDLVCGLKNYKGGDFNLNDFVDVTSGFIVHKTRLGQEVKSYELPGLWNGSMAGWITIFAEVPLETFNPVKTVNDLLKPAHQPQ